MLGIEIALGGFAVAQIAERGVDSATGRSARWR
jgi:hypothetical protein